MIYSLFTIQHKIILLFRTVTLIVTDLYQRAQIREEQKAATLMVTSEDLILSWMTKECKGNFKKLMLFRIVFFTFVSCNNYILLKDCLLMDVSGKFSELSTTLLVLALDIAS